MAHIQRRELKKDEFIDTFDEMLIYVEEHSRSLLTLALALLLAGGSLGSFYWHSRRQEGRAAAALSSALMTFSAPVQEGLPPLPGQGPGKIFSSEHDKYQAAEKEFAAVRRDFPRTRAALMAKHYQALCQFQLGQTDAAVTALRELGRAADRNVAALAQLDLAGFYENLGRRQEAEKIYRQLAEHPTTTVPRPLALLALANLEAQTNPAEARQLLSQVKAEFPDTPIAAEVSRRLELLPAPPPAAQP